MGTAPQNNVDLGGGSNGLPSASKQDIGNGHMAYYRERFTLSGKDYYENEKKARHENIGRSYPKHHYYGNGWRVPSNKDQILVKNPSSHGTAGRVLELKN